MAVSKDNSTSDAFCQAGDTFCNISSVNSVWSKISLMDPSMIDFENQMKNSVMGKVMENFEKAMMEQTKKIEEYRLYVQNQQQKATKENNSQHIPENIRNEGVTLTNLWKKVHKMIVNGPETSKHDKNSKVHIKTIDPELYQMMMSHGLGAWLSTLSSDHYMEIISKIHSETSLWISKIWRFRSSATLYHNNRYDGLLKVCQVAIRETYASVDTHGYNALYTRPPVIYLNEACDPHLVEYLRVNLGLPSYCFSSVPNNFVKDNEESLDLVALDKQATIDLKQNRVPLVVLACAGTPNTGSLDRINELLNISRLWKLWIHLEGVKLAQLALLQVPAQLSLVNTQVNSLTLDIGNWLGIPSIPFVTIIHTDRLNQLDLDKLGFGKAYLCSNNHATNLFPMWLGLQSIGYDGIIQKINHKITMNAYILKMLKELKYLKIINSWQSPIENKTTDNSDNTKQNFLNSVMSLLLEGQKVPLVLLFKYHSKSYKIQNVANNSHQSNQIQQHHDESFHTPIYESQLANGNDLSQTDPECDMQANYSYATSSVDSPHDPSQSVNQHDLTHKINYTDSYLNALNQWLGDTLKSLHPMFGVTTVNIPKYGVCLRISLLNNIQADNITENDIPLFLACLSSHLEIIEATVQQRRPFLEKVSHYPELINIELPLWAGLGCVLYLPEFCRDCLYNEDKQEHQQQKSQLENFELMQMLVDNNQTINEINRNLVDQLRQQDEAFSLGRYELVVRMENPLTGLENEEEGTFNREDSINQGENEGKGEISSSSPDLSDIQSNSEQELILSCYCVRFGLVTDTTVVGNLVDMVLEHGTSVESQFHDFDKYTALLKTGIERATKELELQQENRLKEEGVLRQVPYLDSLINWFNPVVKKDVVGLSLNLSSGEIQQTESTYKNKVQLSSGMDSVFSIGSGDSK